MYYTLLKVPTPLKKLASTHWDYKLKFESPRADCDNVNLQLFDNTTSALTPAYNPLSTYVKGDVVVYHTLSWECTSNTSINGIAPEEGQYWQIKSNVTHAVADYISSHTYSYGDEAVYNYCIWKHIGAVDTVGVHPEEGEHWTQLTTAPKWDFSAVLTPTRWAQLFCDNMNRARPNQNWSVGLCLPDQPKEQAFSNVSVLSAIGSIAEMYETEFWIGQTSHNNYAINIGKKSNVTALTMKYGSAYGFKNIERDEVTENKKTTRLIALGGTKNLLPTYRGGSKRLMLPDKYYLDSNNIDIKNPLEGTYTWDDIYPCMMHATDDYDASKTYAAADMVVYNGISWTCLVSCTGQTPAEGTYWQISEGTVTSVNSEYKLIDKNLTFNPIDKDLIMTDGTQPKIHFITGNLAGYEFPISDFNTTTKQITISTIQDGNDSNLPTAGYTFQVGDQFNVVDFYMPSSYITKAENYLKAKAIEYLDKYSVDQVSYKAEVDTVWASANHIELHAGDLIQVVDDDFGINLPYRIIDLKRYITEPYKYEIVLDNTPYVPSKIQSVINSANKSNTYMQYNNLNTQMAKVRTYKGATEVLNDAFDPGSKYFTEGIAPLFVKTAMALFGTETQQYAINGVEVKTYKNTPNLISWTSGTLSDDTQQDTTRTWNISNGSFNATGDTTSYYAYIRCNAAIGDTGAIILFSETQYKVNADSDYYYFLLGTLTGINGSIRQFFTSNGFTFINGNTITTGKIQSQNENSYFDLDNDEMHFGDAEKYIEWKNSLLKIKGSLAVSPSGVESTIGVFRGTYAINTLYYNGDTVTYDGSTWRYINATAAQNVAPVDGTNWTNISAKGNGISSTSIMYQVSPSGAAPPTGTWLSSIPYLSPGRYLWTRTIITYTDTTTSTSYTVGMMGEKGPIGADGANGVGISHTEITYQASSSGTVAPTGTWSTSIPTISAGQYLWTKTIWDYTDTTNATGYSVGMMGATGATGATGSTGDTGPTGNYFEHRYAVNGSNTEAPSIVNTDTIPSGWTTTLPSMNLYQYMWITTAEKTATGTLVGTWSNPQRFSGAQGAQGDTGPAMSFYGTWNASNIYIGSATVVSVVLYNSVYYIARYDVGGSFTSSTAPNTDTAHWNSFGASFSSIATGLLLAQEAYIENLVVSKLATNSNPYHFLLSILDSSLGIFRNRADSSNINNAIISLGKDVAKELRDSKSKKPAIKIADIQWMGTWDSSIIYYKDDRVYYAGYGTFIFKHDWLETETPIAGILPTNYSYWSILDVSNLGGGSFSELSSDGLFSNGGGILAYDPATGIDSNGCLVGYLLNRIQNYNGISAAVFGIDGTTDSNGTSKSYGGYFTRLMAHGFLENYHAVTGSTSNYTVTKNDCVIQSFSTLDVTLYLPVPSSNGADIGLLFKIMRCSGHNILLVASSGCTLRVNITEKTSSFWITDGYEYSVRCVDPQSWVVTV